MSNLLLALVCLTLGKLLQNVRQFPESSPQVLNLYVIYIALPALVLVQIPKIALDAHILGPVVVAWLVMGASALATWLLSRYFKWSAPVTGALLLVTILGNTSFIGIPLVEAHLGADATGYAILYDQLGTFLALNTVGVAIAHHYSDATPAQAQAGPLWLKMMTFPPFGALLFGFVLGFTGVPEFLHDVLERIADTLVPVVMVAVGLQWRLRIDRGHLGIIVFMMFFILFLKPLLALGLVQLVPLEALAAKTTVLEAAMPAMISTSALAVTYGLAPKLVATIIGYSLILSFLTVWLWSLVV